MKMKNSFRKRTRIPTLMSARQGGLVRGAGVQGGGAAAHQEEVGAFRGGPGAAAVPPGTRGGAVAPPGARGGAVAPPGARRGAPAPPGARRRAPAPPGARRGATAPPGARSWSGRRPPPGVPGSWRSGRRSWLRPPGWCWRPTLAHTLGWPPSSFWLGWRLGCR